MRETGFTERSGVSQVVLVVKKPPANARGVPGGSARKESTFNVGDWGSIPRLGRSPGERPGQSRRHKTHSLDPWVGKIPWRRAWQSAPVFLPGESHGQRSLATVHKVTESDTADRSDLAGTRFSTSGGPAKSKALDQWCPMG